MDFPFDIILIIIDFLPAPDSRNLLKCNKKLNLLLLNKNISSRIDINLLNWTDKLNYEIIKSKTNQLFAMYTIRFISGAINLYPKYALELIFFGYSFIT